MADESEQLEPWGAWRLRIAAARRRRDDVAALWQQNVNKRKGSRDETGASTDVSVNKDWPLTKAKIATLYSQTPEVRLSTEDDRARGLVPAFAKQLNNTLRASSVGTAIEEELADVVNASGISAALIACEKLTETRDVPAVDPATLPPDMQLAVMAGAVMLPVEVVTDIQYPIRRLSPTSLLVPSDFTGSQYDQARWLGYDGALPWASAQREFGLTDAQKEKVLGSDKRGSGTTNSLNTDTTKFRDTEVVNFQEIYYWRHYYHADETNFSALQRVVFVDGLDEPVIHEPYAGQKRMEDGSIVGVKRNPIQVITLTYISDDCLPPSDSTISRHQVNELEDSRNQMALQRKHSIPVRWYNPSMVGEGAKSALERGEYQTIIAVKGQGDRAVGEVARASFPPEKYELDMVIDREITDQWQVGGNQTGNFASGERSAREAGIIQQNFQQRIGQERSKVERHFVAIAEVLGALMSLHGQTPMPPELLGSLTYGIRVDSTVLLDANQRIEQLMRFLNMTAQSGYVNAQPVIAEIAELSGLDPSKVIVDPQPKPPEPVKVSIGGPEDIRDPLMLALLYHNQQGPSPEEVAAAQKVLLAVYGSIVPPPPMDPNAEPARQQPGELAHPKWESAARIDRRAEDGGA